MKYIILLALTMVSLTFASPSKISSFDADFEQTIIDEQGQLLVYNGHVKAMKPYYGFWKYTKPVEKLVYLNGKKITMIEPEIEQVIIKFTQSDFDFFKMIKNAKKIKKDTYKTTVNNLTYTIVMQKSLIYTISYLDELENIVVIKFSNQVQNKIIELDQFEPVIPKDFDIIEG